MARDDDFEDDFDDEEEEPNIEVTEEQFSEYSCPHCGKPIQVILAASSEDEEDSDL